MKKRELMIWTVVALATTSAWAGTLDLNGPWGMEGATDAYSPALTGQHNPFTLMGGGLFHLAFGAILTGSAVGMRK